MSETKSEPLKHTPGYCRVVHWDADESMAQIRMGYPREDSPDEEFRFATYADFRSEEDAREFVRRWNACEKAERDWSREAATYAYQQLCEVLMWTRATSGPAPCLGEVRRVVDEAVRVIQGRLYVILLLIFAELRIALSDDLLAGLSPEERRWMRSKIW